MSSAENIVWILAAVAAIVLLISGYLIFKQRQIDRYNELRYIIRSASRDYLTRLR